MSSEVPLPAADICWILSVGKKVVAAAVYCQLQDLQSIPEGVASWEILSE
jgi:hypothetical protein